MTLRQYGAEVVAAAIGRAKRLQAIDRAVPDVRAQRHRHAARGRLRLCCAASARGRPNGGGQIPAVAVTAYASATDRSSTQAAGYQAHVAKPFEPGRRAARARLVATDDAGADMNETHVTCDL